LGLGHATRCIPIIRALQENNYIPIIASDGIALDLLRKEFRIKTVELPSIILNMPKKENILNGN
jgi:predicted glycosyltransferase